MYQPADGGDTPGRCPYCNNVQREPVLPKQSYNRPDYLQDLRSSPCLDCKALLAVFDRPLGENEGPQLLEFGEHRSIRYYFRESDSADRSRGHVQVFVENDDTHWRDVAQQSGDAQMWEFILDCLRDCVTLHEKCYAWQQARWLPQRLVRIESVNDVLDKARLITPGKPLRYIAFSHCWGNDPAIRTTKDVLNQFEESIPISQLPRTFLDCITVALRLGIQYLWIDSLCIVQDDREEWARNSGVMDKVYRHAFLTVMASSSAGTRHAFLGPEASKPRTENTARAIVLTDDSRRHVRYKVRPYKPYSFPDHSGDLLRQRAWAWQEELFATRAIEFHRHQVKWRCRVATIAESGVAEKLDQYRSASLGDEQERSQIDAWHYLIRDYSARQLTYSSDRLPALSGAASHYNSTHGLTYMAGLWQEHFPYCLAWHAATPSQLEDHVPTWSWISVNARASWTDMITESNAADYQEHAELEHVDCQPSSENPYGEIAAGSSITIRGKVFEAKLDYSGNQMAYESTGKSGKSAGPIVRLDSMLDVMSSDGKQCRFIRKQLGETSDRVHGQVTCLILYSKRWRGRQNDVMLVLGPHPECPDTYQRLGKHSTFRDLPVSRAPWAVLCKKATMRSIKIV